MKLITVLAAVLVASTARVVCAVPALLPFNAQIEKHGAPCTGAIAFLFAIIEQDTDVMRWSNDGNITGTPGVAVDVTGTNGRYAVALGDTALAGMAALPPAVLSGARRLALRVWADGELLEPDLPLLPAPYALDAALLDGQPPHVFATTAATYALALDIAATWSGATSMIAAARTEILNYTDHATNAAVIAAIGQAREFASNLTLAAALSNQAWSAGNFVLKSGDTMSGPLRLAQLFMISTNIPGYLAAGITTQPSANGFYLHYGQTNCAAPVFVHAHGYYLYRHEIDSDGIYDWRIGPNTNGTPVFAMQQYSQDTQPPVTQWSGCTLSAAVWTNTALIDFAGGPARNLAPAADEHDAVTLGQLAETHAALAGIIEGALADTATNLAGVARNLAAATNALAVELQRLSVMRTAPDDIIITNTMSQAAARPTLCVGQTFVPHCNGTLRSVRCWPMAYEAVQSAALHAGVMWSFAPQVALSSARSVGAGGALEFTFAPGGAVVVSGQTYTIIFTSDAHVSFAECPGATYTRGELCLLHYDAETGDTWMPDTGKDLALMLTFDPVVRTRITADGIALTHGASISLNGQDIDARFLNAAGDTLQGDLNANARRITNLPQPAAPGEPATKTYTDGATNALRLALNSELTAVYASRAYVDSKQFVASNLADGAVALAKLNTGSVDTRYIAKTGTQTLQGPLALAGAGDWQAGSDQTRADIVLLHPQAEVRNQNGDMSIAAAPGHAIRLQSFTQISPSQCGRAVMPLGAQQVQVTGKPVSPSSVILLTPCSAVPGTPYAQIDGAAFWIKLPEPVAEDTVINYLILTR